MAVALTIILGLGVSAPTVGPAEANTIQTLRIEQCDPRPSPDDASRVWLSNIDPELASGGTISYGSLVTYFDSGGVPWVELATGGQITVRLPVSCRNDPAVRLIVGGSGETIAVAGQTVEARRNGIANLRIEAPAGVTPTVDGSDPNVVLFVRTDRSIAIDLVVSRPATGSGVSSVEFGGDIGDASQSLVLWQLLRIRTDASSGGGGPTTPPPASGPSPADIAIATAVEQAAGISGASSVLIRDGQPVPVTTTIAAGAGSRGAAVIEAEGLRVTVDGDRGASEATGVAAAVGGEIVCEVCANLAAGTVIEAWVYSTPQLTAAVLVDEELEDGECPLLRIPLGAPLDGEPVEAGAHTLQLRMYTEDGFEVVATGITVGGATPTSIPAGEGPVPSSLSLLALALLSGALGAMGLRRRSVADPS